MTMSKGIAALLAAGLAAGTASGAAAQTPPLTGEAVFKQRCASCHSAVKGQPNRVGPNLFGVMGRKPGTVTFNYSPALKAANLVWAKPNLDRYLAAPTKMVLGTRMVIALTDAKQRAAVIDYLSKLK